MQLRARSLWLALTFSALVGFGAGVSPVALRADAQLPGAISGVVVDDATGQPVADVIVSIRPTSRNTDQERQLTDSRGRFVFMNLLPDNYLINAERFGYTNGGLGALSGGRGGAVAVSSGQWLSNSTIRLARSAAIEGTVVDEAGEPVVATRITLLARTYIAGEAQWTLGPPATTDDRGAFRFLNLPPRTYALLVPSIQWATSAEPDSAGGAQFRFWDTADLLAVPAERGQLQILGDGPTPPPSAGGERRVYASTYYPAAQNIDDADALNLKSGERRVVTINLTPVRTVSVSGRVIGADEQLRGLRVRLLPGRTPQSGPDTDVAAAFLRPDGSFVFTDVPSGDYTVLANESTVIFTTDPASAVTLSGMRGPGPITFRTNWFQTQPGLVQVVTVERLGAKTSGSTAVSVGSVDVSGVEVMVNAGSTLSGTVVRLADGTADSAGAVIADPVDGDARRALPEVQLHANDNGAFKIGGLQPGRYLLRYRGSIAKSITWQGKDLTEQPIDIAPGVDITGVVITTTSDGARLEGLVRDRTGAPAPNTSVVFFPTNPSSWQQFGIRPNRILVATTSPTGTYLLTALPAGDYYVAAVHAPREQIELHRKFFESLVGRASRVTLDWGERRIQNLTSEPNVP